MATITGELMVVSGRYLKDAAKEGLDFLIGPRYFDSRVQDWPMMSGKSAVLVAALYMVAVPLARQAMGDRKPVDVAAFVMWHNLAMAGLSLWMVVETLRSQYVCAGWDKKLMIWGTVAEPGDTFSPSCRRLAFAMYVHYLSKVLEFTDTFIMILKRNDHQISFLHIYHHASTFLCWWCGVNFTPGGDAYFCCALNSFVHVIMYSYYLVSSAKVLRIPVAVKKSITIMQMVQFALLFSQALYGMFWATYYRPRIVVFLALAQGVVFITLFGDFFRKAYRSKQPPKAAEKAGINCNCNAASVLHLERTIKAS